MNALRRQAPRPWPNPPDIGCHTQTPGRPRSPRSRCHSAHERLPRGSSQPARVSSMLCERHRRRQPAGGPDRELLISYQGAGEKRHSGMYLRAGSTGWFLAKSLDGALDGPLDSDSLDPGGRLAVSQSCPRRYG